MIQPEDNLHERGESIDGMASFEGAGPRTSRASTYGGNPYQYYPDGSPESTEGFQHILNLLIRRIWIIALIMAIGMAVTVFVVMRLPKIYTSTAVLQVVQKEQKVLANADDSQDTPATVDFVNSVVQVIASRNVMKRVVRANKLQEDPAFASGGMKPDEGRVISQLQGKVSVALRRSTRLIDISVDDHDPVQAATLASAVVKEFLNESFEQRMGASREANEFLKEEAAKLKSKLEESEQELQGYRESHREIPLDQNQNIVLQKLQEVNRSVTEAKDARLKLESDLESLDKVKQGDTGSLLRISSVAAIPQVASSGQDLLKAQADFASMKERYLPKHPKYIGAENSLQAQRQVLSDAAAKAREILAANYQAMTQTESKLEESFKEQQEKALEFNKVSIRYNVLAREVETDRATYQGVMTRLRETGVEASMEAAPYRIIEEPSIPGKPSKPKRSMILLVAFALQFLACAGAIIAADRINSGFRSVDGLESMTGLTVVGALPKEKPFNFYDNGEIYHHPLLQTNNSPIAESFRTLRTNMSLLSHDDETKILLVTSSIPSEGKSFTALGLAIAYSQLGKRTLIIDGDLRRPTIHHVMIAGKQVLGLGDYLVGGAAKEEIIQKSDKIPNLDFITAGINRVRPGEILAAANIEEHLKKISERYDYVIIDSAPVNSVSDTLLLAKGVQNAILIVSCETTPSKVVQRSLMLLGKTSARLCGAVLNKIPKRGSSSYYYYYYNNRYVKDSVYGENKDNNRS